MEHEAFDRLARRLGTSSNRRVALGALAGLGLTLGPVAGAAKSRKRRRGKGRTAASGLPQNGSANPSALTGNCANLRAGANLAGCDFAGRNLVGADLHGATAREADFSQADLCAADLHGATLHGASFADSILVRANLRGATVGGVDFTNALFCQTILPDGSTDDSGCPPPGTAVCCTDAECDEGRACHFGGCLLGDLDTCSDPERVDYYRNRFQYCFANVFPGDCHRCTCWMGCNGEIDTETVCGTVDGGEGC